MDEGYDELVGNTVAQICDEFYGADKFLVNVHNELRKRYNDYIEVYKVVKPTLLKHVDASLTGKVSSSNSVKSRTALNSEIQQILSKVGYSNEIVSCVASTVVKNMGVGNGKQQIYRSIVAKYGQGKGRDIYNHIKNHI